MQFRDNVRNNFSTRALKVQTCLKTLNMTGERFGDVSKISIELHPSRSQFSFNLTYFVSRTSVSILTSASSTFSGGAKFLAFPKCIKNANIANLTSIFPDSKLNASKDAL